MCQLSTHWGSLTKDMKKASRDHIVIHALLFLFMLIGMKNKGGTAEWEK